MLGVLLLLGDGDVCQVGDIAIALRLPSVHISTDFTNLSSSLPRAEVL